MGKKGKGKGKGKGGAGGKRESENTLYMKARIMMREKALLNVEAEEMELSDRVNEMKQTVHVLETEKNDSIKRLLSKIHRADSDKAESIEEMNNSIKENQKKRKSNDDVRNKALDAKLAELSGVKFRNSEIESDIERWRNYELTGSLDHQKIILQLEEKIEIQMINTENMKNFILRQIETAKNDAENIKRELENNRKEQAVVDALNNLPGSVQESRKSDKLQKLVEWQGTAVNEDKDAVIALRNETKKLVQEAAKLRIAKFEAPKKNNEILDWEYTRETMKHRPSIEKLALTDNVYSTMYKNQESSQA